MRVVVVVSLWRVLEVMGVCSSSSELKILGAMVLVYI
jgi:hypothetical protein